MFRLCESPTINLSKKSSKVLSGLFAECDTLNQNGRIYPGKVYMPALEGVIPKIKNGGLLGELDHPQNRDEICLSNVSHVIKECRVEGNKVYGTVELLDTPSGKIAQALNEAGIPLGISSRGVGNTRRISEGDEVTDFTLITYDLVADPSFSNAILTESAKITLIGRLDDVASTLPLNESVGNSDELRSKINSIKEGLDKVPTTTSILVDSIGQLTEEKISLEESNKSLSEDLENSKLRNKSLAENMSKLQDSYNLLSESLKTIQTTNESEIKKLKESHEDYVASLKKSFDDEKKQLKESYRSKIDGLNDEVVELRKLLAIEKRGLSTSQVMPMLEGLSTQKDIDHTLNSLKKLNTRKVTQAPDIDTLTEGISINSRRSVLSKIVSSV